MRRAGDVDQQHGVDAARLQALQPRDDLVRGADQRRILAGDLGVGEARGIVETLRLRPARQRADALERLAPELVGLLALRLAGDDMERPGDADLAGPRRLAALQLL